MTSIRSHCDCEDCGDSGHPHQVTTTEVYPDTPNNPTLMVNKSNHKNKSPLVWGEDITFLDHHQHDNRAGEATGSSRYIRHTTEGVDQDNKSILQRQLQHCDETNNKLELTTNMVSLSELSDMSVMESDKYISLSGFNFFPKDEETEDLNDICSSLQLVDQGMVETHPCTVDEIQHSSVAATPAPEDPPPSGRVGLRRTRNASRRMSVVNGDDNSFCSQSETISENPRKRNMSEHSMMSGGSYDDPDSPYNGSGRRKRRRYEEDPSEDPAFEKSRKNAIIAKRNREKKKALMDDMEKRCDKLTTDNNQLESDNGKLRRRVQTLEEEVYYLKSVLANESSLSSVLSNLKGADTLRFSSSFDPSKYNKKQVGSSSSNHLKVSGGLCLHVDGHQVSMELCAQCSQVMTSHLIIDCHTAMLIDLHFH